jgi:hypothetical protein
MEARILAGRHGNRPWRLSSQAAAPRPPGAWLSVKPLILVEKIQPSCSHAKFSD